MVSLIRVELNTETAEAAWAEQRLKQDLEVVVQRFQEGQAGM
jgi:hypothetical protein